MEVGPDTVRYPDVVVDVAGGKSQDLTATAPVLIAEVLSPSSMRSDLRDKSSEYLRLQSLCAYLVLAQNEPKARPWQRGTAGFPNDPQVIQGQDSVIKIAELSIDLVLTEIYARI